SSSSFEAFDTEAPSAKDDVDDDFVNISTSDLPPSDDSAFHIKSPLGANLAKMFRVSAKRKASYKSAMAKVGLFKADKLENKIISRMTPSFTPDSDLISQLIPIDSTEKTTYEAVRSCLQHTCFCSFCFFLATERDWGKQKFLAPLEEYFRFQLPETEWDPYLSPPEFRDILSTDRIESNEKRNETISPKEKLRSGSTEEAWPGLERDRFLKYIRRKTKDFPLRLQVFSGLKSGDTLQSLYANFLNSQNFIQWYTPLHAKAQRSFNQVIETVEYFLVYTYIHVHVYLFAIQSLRFLFVFFASENVLVLY
ncbi:hypothetical protein RFI_02152, partial [Reticulomyxa filosa]